MPALVNSIRWGGSLPSALPLSNILCFTCTDFLGLERVLSMSRPISPPRRSQYGNPMHTVEHLHWAPVGKFCLACGGSQSCKMSNLLHGPWKARKSWHFYYFKPTKQNLWGSLWWINVDKLSIHGIFFIGSYFVCTNLPKNCLSLLIFRSSQTFYSNWPIFLHGYIRHIRDILQLWRLPL